MERGKEEEGGRGEGKWREVPVSLTDGAVQTAAKSFLENRGAHQLEHRRWERRTRAARKKPPLPPVTSVSTIFGVSLEAQQPRLLIKPLSGCGQGVWLPRVFVECIQLLRNRTDTSGLFRKSGSITRQRKLRAILEGGGDLDSPEIHDVTGILKQYLRELPSPLIPPSLGPLLEWVWSCDEEEKKVELVMCALLQLPLTNIKILRELCQLLSSVANNKIQSLMDSHSLAVVMTPNILLTQHFSPSNLETTLTTGTGIVQLMIDHAHLIGLAPSHVIDHAYQSTKEGVASESSENESLEDVEYRKNRISAVTNRVLEWRNKLRTTLGGGGVSRDTDHTHSPIQVKDGVFQSGKSSKQKLFEPSLSQQSVTTPKTPRHGNNKRRRSFLSRRHTDSRHGNRSIFHNPFRGQAIRAAGEFYRLGSSRFTDKKFPWVTGHAPSTPDSGDVQLVGFESREKKSMMNFDLSLDENEATDCGDNNDRSSPPVAMTAERDRNVNEKHREKYLVARKPSGKRMRCEVEGGGGERSIKRRHTIYISSSQESLNEVGVAKIRSSKSAMALGRTTSDFRPGFKFSQPTPQRKPNTACSVATDTVKEAPPTPSGVVPFTFSNPRLYVARQRRRVTNDKEEEEEREGERVCGVSPIPYLPELATTTPVGPSKTLNHGFVDTPSVSPNLLQQISSELIQRYPQATPLATPTTNKETMGGVEKNDSYLQAVYPPPSSICRKPFPLHFNSSPPLPPPPPPPIQGSEVVQEVSYTFHLNSPGCHGNNSGGPNRVPLTPLQYVPPVTANNTLLPTPHKPLLQKRFPLTPRLGHRSKFTDLSSPFVSMATSNHKTRGRTPHVKRRAQMYIIPSSGNHGDNENKHSGDWIV